MKRPRSRYRTPDPNRPRRGNKRAVFTVEQRHLITTYAVEARYTRRATYATIAKELKDFYGIEIAVNTISRFVTELFAEQIKRLDETVKEQKLLATGTLEHVAAQALEAWEKSKKPQVQTTSDGVIPPTAAAPAPTGGNAAAQFLGAALQSAAGQPGIPSAQTATAQAIVTAIKTRITESNGDPRYLDVVRGAIGDICKIWGIGRGTDDPNEAGGELIVKVVHERVPLRPDSKNGP